MKLHLEQKITLSNTPPKIDPIKNENLFIYYSDNYVVICDLSSSKVLHRFKYEDVQILKIHGNHLYICTNEIYMLDLDKFEIVDVIKLSKALINFISFYDNTFIVSKIDNKISFYNGKRKLFEVANDIFVENLFISEHYCGYFDTNKAVVYSTKGLKVQEYESEYVVAMHSISSQVLILLSSGSLIDLISQKCIETNLEIENAHFSDKFISVISGNKLIELSYSGNILNSKDISKEIEEYSGSAIDNYALVKEQLRAQIPKIKNIKRLKANDYESTSDACLSDGHSEDDESYNSDDNESSVDSQNRSFNDFGSDTDTHYNSDSNLVDQIESDATSEENQSETVVDENESQSYQSGNLDSDDADNLNFNSSESISEIEQQVLGFSILSHDFIKTDENDFIILNNNKISKIFSFVDDLTDSVSYENFLLVSTSSGYLKYCNLSNYTSGNFIFDSKLVKMHPSAITCMKISQDIVITSSNDRTLAFSRLENTGTVLKFTKVYEMDKFNSLITSFVYKDNLIAVATRDSVLQIYQTSSNFPVDANSSDYKLNLSGLNISIDPECLSYSLFFHSFENTSTQKIHQKPINHLSITSKFIITSSNDKTSKILDFNGTTVKSISYDKVLCSSFDSKYIAICSQKGAKIFHSSSLSPITSFQSKRPILASYFYKGYFLAISDVLRIYDIDKKKCIKSYDVGLVNCWCFNFPFACGENKIIIFDDVSVDVYNKLLEKARNMKEDTILFDKFIRENNFEKAMEVALNGKYESQIYKVISLGIDHDPNLEFLKNSMKNGEIKSRIFDILIKNSGFKASVILNRITSLFTDTKIDKKKKAKLIEIVSKHVEAIDDVYIELMGLELFRK